MGDFFDINKCMTTNFLNPTSFVLSLDRLENPNAEFTVQTMVLPEVSVDGAPYQTRSRNIMLSADKIVYGPFDCTFLVDEDLANYQEIYNWLYNQVDTITDSHKDVTLSIMSSANNVIKQIKFVDARPTNLSSLPFDITTGDIEYVTAAVTFEYSYFEIT